MIDMPAWTRVLSITLLVVGVATASADEALPEQSTKMLDIQVNRAVLRTITKGVELYNGGDRAGCFRLFEGSLLSLGPLLEYRPELKAKVDEGLQIASNQNDQAQAALALREVLDDVYDTTRAARIGTLWDRLGGQEAVEAIVHDFVALAANDSDVETFREKLDELDEQGVARLERLMVEFLSAQTGGPLEYSGRDMQTIHEGMGVAPDELNALAADLVAVLRKHEVADREIDELTAILGKIKDDIVENESP